MTDWLTASRSTGLSYGGSCLKRYESHFVVVFKSSHVPFSFTLFSCSWKCNVSLL